MRYNLLRKAMMDACPSLFTDEDDVLEHLFFVNGNGYEWAEGELQEKNGNRTAKQMVRESRKNVCAFYRSEIANYKKRGLDTTWVRGQLHDWLHKSPAALRRMEVAHRFELVEGGWGSLDGRSIENGILIRFLYPLCEYAKILHVPANVKPDWLAAARKAYEMALSPRWRSRKGDAKANRKYLRQARDLLGTF